MSWRLWFLVGLVLGVSGVGGCARERDSLLLASTTSTEDSGLFGVLLPAFEAAHPELQARLTAVGTGQALTLGRRRDADVLLVHAPDAEARFVADGYGVGRCPVMYNDFILVGPASDPAAVAGAADVAEALARVAAVSSSFVSRGDDSGTHRKERSLWKDTGVEPSGGWYLEIGQGMAEALRMAAEKRAYTLTDRATYLNLRDGLELELMVEGDPRLFNPYGVIPVAGAANAEGALAFARWVTGAEAQELIRGFGVERFGTSLFVPNADGCDL